MDNTNKEPLFAEERQNQILELLKKNDKIMVPELICYFNVSPATIRNDLRDLSNAGLLKRTHGGAMSNAKTGFELNSYQKAVENLQNKKAVALKALEYIEDGDTIAIDTGTTTLEFAKLLDVRKNLTIVVNDIEIARVLEDTTDATIIMIGGIVRRGFHCTIGPKAIDLISGLSVDKVFMGVNGLTALRGMTTPDLHQADIKKAMMNISGQVILLCDSVKIGNVAFAQIAPAEKIDILITDDGVNDTEIENLKLLGITVELVNYIK